MVFRLYIYFCLFHFAGYFAATAQIRVSLDSFTVKQGLSQGFVSDICQDKDGFIWLGTMDGLNRFDGYGVKVFRSEPDNPYPLSENYITEIEEDVLGNLWIGTYSQGLFYFDKRRELFYKINPQGNKTSPGKNIVKLTYYGGFLFCKDERWIAVYDVRTLEQVYNAAATVPPDFSRNMQAVYSESAALPIFINPSEFNELFCSFLPDLSLWYGRGDTLHSIQINSNDRSFTQQYLPFAKIGIPSKTIPTVLPAIAANEVVVGFSQGLVVINRREQEVVFSNRFQSSDLPLFSSAPFQIIADSNGRVYFPARFGHIWFDTRTRNLQRVYGQSQPQPFGGKSQIVTRDGFFMIGTGGYGLYYYNTNVGVFKGYPTRGTLLGLLEGKELIINTQYSIEVVSLENGQVVKSISPATIFGKGFYIENGWQQEEQPDLLWLIGRNVIEKKIAIGQYHLRTGKLKLTHSLFPIERIASFDRWLAVKDNKGVLWQCYQHVNGRVEVKASMLQNDVQVGTWEVPYEGLLEGNQLPVEQVASIDSCSYFATRFGLFELNRLSGSWKHYKHEKGNPNSLRSNKIRVVYCDPGEGGRFVWVGTDGAGLCKLDRFTKLWIQIGEDEGLPSNVVYSILPDGAGNLWLSTTRGLCSYAMGSGFIRRFSSYDGLQHDEFNSGQYAKLPNGSLVFGGVKGQTLFNPADALSQKLPLGKVQITGLVLNGKMQGPLTDSGLLRQAINYTKKIILPFHQNFFTLYFALPNYLHASQKLYRYKLEGLQENWIETGELNQATFTNLDPGTYTFRVNARLAAGEWQKEEAVLEIHVLPPWYRTAWFLAGLAFLIAALVYGVYRYRLHQQLQVHQMRHMIASDLHDEIGSTISSITVYSDVLQQQLENERHKNLAERISLSSRNILISMSDIVWTINPKNDAFVNIILRMQSYAHELLDAQQKHLIFEVQPQVKEFQLNMTDRKNFYLIFKEALNNAIKYATCTEVHIAIGFEQGGLHFSLSDNGIGFDADTPMEGNGIANMQRRARDLKGRFSLQTKSEQGTTVSLWFPIKS